MEYTQSVVPGFVLHSYRRTFQINFNPEEVWEVLLRKDTFTDHQVWPYRVEFAGPSNATYMEPGEENTHHGPWMSFTGAMGEIKAPSYRELRYYYGSYFLSIRWIRPERLQVWVRQSGDGASEVTMQVDSLVKPWISRIWTRMQAIFWSGFGRWISSLLRKAKSRH